MIPDRLTAYRAWLGPGDFARLEAAVQRPLLRSIRINTLKIDPDEARRTWPDEYGWTVLPVPFCPTGWQIAAGGRHPSQTLEYRMGCYYIQDAASMLPGEMFDFDETDRPVILDMAASPGGKTTHLACRTRDAGLIIANDSSAARLGALRSNLQTWGAIGTAVTHYSGERFGPWFPDTFDAVLLDAPCSGESLRTADRRKTRPVSTRERQQLHQRQVRLLTSALQATRPGGQIVYATCTLAPEEDEAVVDALLQAYPRQVDIDSLERLLAIAAPGLTGDGERVYDARLRRAVRLWPHLYDTSGFFAARIRKRDVVPVPPQAPPARGPAESGLAEVSRNRRAVLMRQLRDAYGFDLAPVLERQGLSLWQRRKSIYAIPELYLARLGDLACVAGGMLLGEEEEEFVPSHELVSRFSLQFTGRRLRLEPDRVEKWLAGYDLRGSGAAPYPTGTVILVEDERSRFLGRGKVLADRLRNLLPKA